MDYHVFFFTPQTPHNWASGTFGAGFGISDMQQLSAVVTTGWVNSQSGGNIVLQKYDPLTKQGTPGEVIVQYQAQLRPNTFLTPKDMAPFNNELILDNGGNQQDQRFVLSLLNGSALMIYTDESLF